MKIAIVTPSNGYYLKSHRCLNAKIHPYRRWVYELVNKLGHQCDYIGNADLVADKIVNYDAIFLLNQGNNDKLKNKELLTFLSKNKNIVMTYNTKAAREWGISSSKKHFFSILNFADKNLDYKVNNIDSVITKINRRWLKNALPLKSFFTLPVMNICGVSSCEILATWGQTERPALVKLKKNGGNVIYFSGILAGTNNDFLRYVLSFLESKNNVFYPLIPKNKKCCVSLFYDYEGRYGNSKYGEYTKKGLGYILSTHRKYNIKATFNVVGKICEVFPQSIKDIVNDGHEIASHTYEHVVPRSAGYKTLNDSIKKSIEVSKSAFGENLRGFRSPKSQWNANLVSILEDYKFHWNAEDEAASLPYYMVLNKRLSLIRIPITCDDFPYISESCSGDYMLEKFKKAIERGIKQNSFVAIGFHPWIEGIRDENLNVLELFLSYISSCNNLAVMTLGEIADWWRQRNSK